MAEEANRTPTPWELLRAIESVAATARGIDDKMLTKDRFDEYQRGTDRRFETLERRQAGWEAESKSAHVGLDARIDAVEEKAAKREDEARANRGRVWLAVAGVVLAVILPRVWEVLRGTGVQP